MVISRKILRNVSLTAHPQGCERYVRNQVTWVKDRLWVSREASPYAAPKAGSLPRRVLILGGSTGYGLSSRIVAAFAGGASTINVSFEREPSESKTATPGWYNSKAFEKEASKAGLYAESIYGDAFSSAVKEQTANLIRESMGQVDLVVYSLASPMRIDPVTGTAYRSVLKPIGKTYTALSVDATTGIIETATIEPADDVQIEETVKVMGGEDWTLWMSYLQKEGLLAQGVKTVAYSYIGPEITYPVYREGTIGKAKEDLERTALELTSQLGELGGEAYVSVNKALVTRASAVIPVVPLYIAILYKVMKEKELHEQCTEQIYRLFIDRLYVGDSVPVDEEGRIRLDDWEMREDIQNEVERRWAMQKEGELITGGDLAGFQSEYDQIHGFGFDSIDYSADVDPRVV
jgi:enoyl-[acyl-carrier protein] reductase / trans-2-enoyl-CoA reductase (NAD+)